MKRKLTVNRTRDLATSTVDAYSFSRYGWTAWNASAQLLARRGYDADQIEAIMRSKWMRWASDMSSNPSPTSKDLERYLDKYADTECSLANVNRLVAGTL